MSPAVRARPARVPARPPPRERARPPTRRTRRDRRRLAWWSLAVVAMVGALGGIVAASPLLDVERVDVVGVAPGRVAQVRDAAGIDVGDSIVALWPGSIERRVRRLPWVARVSVTRDLPGSVRITVVPRVPVAWVGGRRGPVLVDRHGRVLERAASAPAGFPELVGVRDVAGPGGVIRPAAPARVAGALDAGLRSRAATIAFADGALTVQIAGGPEVRFGPARGLAVKARVAAAVLTSVEAARSSYVDVSVPAAPVSG